jgi:hypothetical protein
VQTLSKPTLPHKGFSLADELTMQQVSVLVYCADHGICHHFRLSLPNKIRKP